MIYLLCTSNVGQGIDQTSPIKSQNWSVENVFASNESDLLISKALVNHTALVVSDGSFKLQRGTSATIIEDRGNQQSRALIVNRVPYRRIEHSPYRAEVAGVFGIVTHILRIEAKYKVTSDSIRVDLDGQAVVKVL